MSRQGSEPWCDRCGETSHATTECPYGRGFEAAAAERLAEDVARENVRLTAQPRRGPLRVTELVEQERRRERMARLEAEMERVRAREAERIVWHRRAVVTLVVVAIGLAFLAYCIWLQGGSQ